MHKSRILIFSIVTLFQITCPAQEIKTNYINSFENTNHPQIAYWFFAANIMPEASYKGKIDSFVKYSKYTLVYLTQRDGCDFYETKTMHPVFKKLVEYAHLKGLKIGLQIWKDDRGTLVENTDRQLQRNGGYKG